MNGVKERSIDRWLQEFCDKYLSMNFDHYAFREVKENIVFVFVFKFSSGTMQISIEHPTENIPDKPTKCWLDSFRDELSAGINKQFFEV